MKKIKEWNKTHKTNLYHFEANTKLVKIANQIIKFDLGAPIKETKEQFEIYLKKNYFSNLISWTFAKDITNGKIALLAIETSKTKPTKKQMLTPKNNNQKKDKTFWKNYYQKNKDKMRLKQQKYYQNHKSRIRKAHQKYYLENKEKINKYYKTWKQKNKKKVIKYSKIYYQKNKAKLKRQRTLKQLNLN